MELRYKLLGCGEGVILSRQPDVVSDELVVLFEGAPDGATAIFENEGGRAYYRELSNGSCKVPISNMPGVTTVSVTTFEGDGTRFLCESIVARLLRGGEMLVAPDDMNLPNVVAELRIQNQILSESVEKLSDLPEKVERLLSRIRELERKTQIIM